MNTLKNDCERIKFENEALRKSLEMSENEIKDQISLKLQIQESLNENNETLKKMIQEAENEINDLKKQLDVDKNEFECLNKTLDTKEDHIKSLEAELGKLKQEDSELKFRLENSRIHDSRLQNEINLLRVEIQTNQERLTATDDLIKSYEKELGKTKKKLERKKLEITSLSKSRLIESATLNEEDKNRISELEETVLRLKAKNLNLKERIGGDNTEKEGNLSESDREDHDSFKKQINALEVCKKDEFNGKHNGMSNLEEKVEKIENYYLMTQVRIST